jgi:hypothetical protein
MGCTGLEAGFSHTLTYKQPFVEGVLRVVGGEEGPAQFGYGTGVSHALSTGTNVGFKVSAFFTIPCFFHR